MTKEEINAIPRKEARELLVSIPGGRGYDDRILLAVESAMNLEWWRGYHAALTQAKPTEARAPKAPISQYQIELLARAHARIAKSQVRYGEKVAYPADMHLVIDLVAQIESLTSALEADAALRAMPLQDHVWQPIKTAAPRREVWLFTPGRRLGSDAADDIRFECPANWTWATMWMPAIIPAPPMVAEDGTK